MVFTTVFYNDRVILKILLGGIVITTTIIVIAFPHFFIECYFVLLVYILGETLWFVTRGATNLTPSFVFLKVKSVFFHRICMVFALAALCILCTLALSVGARMQRVQLVNFVIDYFAVFTQFTLLDDSQLKQFHQIVLYHSLPNSHRLTSNNSLIGRKIFRKQL